MSIYIYEYYIYIIYILYIKHSVHIWKYIDLTKPEI